MTTTTPIAPEETCAKGQWHGWTNATAGHATAVALAITIALRAIGLIVDGSLGLDEARLVVNIAERSYLNLLPPLAHDQSAPLAFLWLQRGLVDVLGVREEVLRAIPAVAGVLSVLLIAAIARRISNASVMMLATGMAAMSPLVLHYSLQVKQYTFEMLVTAVLVFAMVDLLEQPTPRRAWLVTLAGTVSVWCSAPAVFVLSGLALVLYFERNRLGAEVRGMLAPMQCIWAVSFGLAYHFVYGPAAGNAYMKHFWAPVLFIPGTPDLLSRLLQASEQTLWSLVVGYPRVIDAWWFVPLKTGVSFLVLGAMLVGAWRLYVSRRSTTIMLGVPILAVLAASMAGAYPFYVRTVLFAAPLFYLLMAGGVVWLLSSFGGGAFAMRWCVVGFLLVPPLLEALGQVSTLDRGEETRELIETLRRERRPGEAVYVASGGIPAWSVYTTDWSAPDRGRLRFLNEISSPGGPAFENAPSRGQRVHAEGQFLLYETELGHELYGASTGIEWVLLQDTLRSYPDPGWIENEAERVRQAAKPVTWMLVAGTRGEEYTQVLDELARLGSACSKVQTGRGSFLARCSANVAGGEGLANQGPTSVLGRSDSTRLSVSFNAALSLAERDQP